MTESFGDKLRWLLATDIYTDAGRLRSDDMLVRERAGRGLGEAAARIRELISAWRAERVPPSTREHPFPPPEVMEPIRRAERLLRAVEDTAAAVRSLPVLNSDRVWDRVRKVGLEELMQFDWTMVGESDTLASELGTVLSLDQLDIPATEARVSRIKEAIGERRRYLEIT